MEDYHINVGRRIPDLENILAQLYSDEARAVLVTGLAWYYDIQREFTDEANYYLQRQSIDDAVEKESRAPVDNRRLDMYSYVLNNSEGSLEIAERAVKANEDVGRYKQAGWIAEDNGLLIKAIELYERAGDYESAGRSAEKAAQVEARIGFDKDALTELIERSVKNYQIAKCIKKAANVPEQFGLKQRALQVYEEELWFNHAARFAENNGMKKRAKFYRRLEALIDPNTENSEQNNDMSTAKWLGGKIFTEVVSDAIWKGLKIAGTAGFIVLAQLTGVVVPAGIAGTGVYSVYSMLQHPENSSVVVEDCPERETLEGKFCRTYKYDDVISSAEKRYSIPNGLLAGIAMVESYGDPLQLNHEDDGSAGLFQLETDVAKEKGLVVYDEGGVKLRMLVEKKGYNVAELKRYDDRFDVKKSTETAAHYLHDLHNDMAKRQKHDRRLAGHDTWDLAVAAYKVGPDNVAGYFSNSQGVYVELTKEYWMHYVKRKVMQDINKK